MSDPNTIWDGKRHVSKSYYSTSPVPPTPPPAPVPGYVGGCYVPPNVAMTIPNAAIQAQPGLPIPSIHQSPTTPIVQQPTFHAAVTPSSVQAGMTQFAPGSADGRPMTQQEMALVMQSRQSGGVLDVPAPSRVAPPEMSRIALDVPVPPPSSPILITIEPPQPLDPIAEQIAKAKAAAASGKL